MKKIIETQRAPGAIGPYVQGVDLGSMVFTSGQIPVCPQTGEIPADVQDQARLSLENVKAIVVAAGLSVGDIIKMTVFITDLNDFATINEVPFAAIRFILDSAKLNCALSQEGLSGKWGLHIGATLEKQCERGLLAKDLSSSIVIRTSAASDARMGGATLPAMSNSGSGNQGITATMPVVVVAEHFGADDERLARALMLSHLSAIYIHNQLPRLSALCAATTAAMGAAAGMAWLVDGRYETISMAISSMIGDVSGMICDGASNSCAMKVSTSASAAWKAVLMALDDTAVTGNEGIVAHDVEQSIANLCALASHSMQQTDRQIIEIMASKAR